MEQELEQAQEIYQLIVEFFVNYSFQLFGALIVFAIGAALAGYEDHPTGRRGDYFGVARGFLSPRVQKLLRILSRGCRPPQNHTTRQYCDCRKAL